jgi:hypothetical protein
MMRGYACTFRRFLQRPHDGEEGPEEGQVVKLASWNDEEQTSLAAHEPEVTDVVVGLGSTNPVH